MKLKSGIIGVWQYCLGAYRQTCCRADVRKSRYYGVGRQRAKAAANGRGKGFRLPAIFAEGTELIHSGTCEAVLIAVPHYQHPTLAIEAFRAGLHVMCEKPAGVYTLQVREMNTEADRHPELTFGMMFDQRTNCVLIPQNEGNA